jgi:two-component system nitrate/nitrite response regulator NarL
MRLLVCGDHMLVDALSMALSYRGHTVVATALDPDEAVEAAREQQPDACLLDVSFPRANGLNAIGPIHEVSPDTKVVILSGSINAGLVADAIAKGAQGFVGKEKPVGAILEALELASQGDLAVDPFVLRKALQTHAQNCGPLWVLESLTERERAVLRCIMDGLSTEQMADQLRVQRGTVRTHVLHLLTKLGVHSRLQAVLWMTANASTEPWPNFGVEVDASTSEAEAIARLTARELDVLRSLSEGLSGNQIGALLHVSPNTVRTHIQSILHKLHVHSAFTAVEFARRAGVDGLREEEAV